MPRILPTTQHRWNGGVQTVTSVATLTPQAPPCPATGPGPSPSPYMAMGTSRWVRGGWVWFTQCGRNRGTSEARQVKQLLFLFLGCNTWQRVGLGSRFGGTVRGGRRGREGCEAGAHVSAVRKQERWVVVLSSLPPCYSVWECSLGNAAAHIQAGPPTSA